MGRHIIQAEKHSRETPVGNSFGDENKLSLLTDPK